eukprot:UN26860
MLLEKAKALVEYRDPTPAKLSPLHYAVKKGDVPVIERIFKSSSQYDATLLQSVCTQGQEKVLKLFIDYQYKINNPVDQEVRNTPLIIAATFGKTTCVKVLLEFGAKANAKNNNGENALIAGCL